MGKEAVQVSNLILALFRTFSGIYSQQKFVGESEILYSPMKALNESLKIEVLEIL